MRAPPPEEMLQRVRSLPAAAALLQRLPAEPRAHLVGGAVRDLLLDGRPLDLDVVVEGHAIALARRLGDTVVAHGRFGTCTVTVDGSIIDLATARGERYLRPGALPEVKPAPLAEDLRRRDFTVNAIAVALNGPEPGALSAVDHALDDLSAARLRVLHDASFADDPTRLLRLARYAGRLTFAPEPHTRTLAQSAVARGALATVSGARIGAELRLLGREPAAVEALEWVSALGIDTAIAPGFGLCEPELARRALELLPAGERADRLVLALATLHMRDAARRRLLDALAFPASDREVIVLTAQRAAPLARALDRARSPAEIAAAARGAPPELVALAGALGPADAAAQWLSTLRQVGLVITGDDLLAAGVPAGPGVGRGLRAALAAKLDGRAPDRAAELEHALAAARAGE